MLSQLDALNVPQFSVKGEYYDSTFDDQPPFSFSFPDAHPKQYSIGRYLRNRELGNRSLCRPNLTYDVNKLDVYVRNYKQRKADEYSKPTIETVYASIQERPELARIFAESNICAVNGDGTILVRSRIDDEDEMEYDGRGRGTKLLYICKLAPKYLAWPISMILEDIPLHEPVHVVHSGRSGLMASMVLDMCAEDLPLRGPAQGVIRVDLLVPWTGIQISSINTACLAPRMNRAGKEIEKRCLRVHDRGVIVNCGFQMIFITVTPRALNQISIPGEVRKCYYFEPSSTLGVEVSVRQAVEKRIMVDVGETLSCRFAFPMAVRSQEVYSRTRMEMRPHPGRASTVRVYKPRDVGDPQQGARAYLARQVLSIESLMAEILSKWYAGQTKPAKYIAGLDYESDILRVDEASCSAVIGVFVKSEVRYSNQTGEKTEVKTIENVKRKVRSPRETTQFDIVYVEFEWLILEGAPRKPRVCMHTAGISNQKLFDKSRWYSGNPRIKYEPHEVIQIESTKTFLELRPQQQPEMLLQQVSKMNRLYNSQSEIDSMEDLYAEGAESQE